MAIAAEPIFTTRTLQPDDEAVVRLHGAYLERYDLGPRNPDYGRDRLWVGVEAEGRVVAVFSEMAQETAQGRIVEVPDCYCEPTEAGWTAVIAGVVRYQQMVQAGTIFALRHTVLWANQRFLKFVVELSGDEPRAVIFEHRRHEGG